MRSQRNSPSRALRVAAALALACIVGALTWSAGSAPAAGQPNIVVIQTDDQTLADLTATRNQLATALKAEAERIARLESEITNIEAGLAAAAESRPDMTAL